LAVTFEPQAAGWEFVMGFFGAAMTDLSKLMSCLLRTRPVQVGLRPDADGFVPLDELAAVVARRPRWAWITPDVVRQSARQDAKGRYELKEHLVRAAYKRTFDPKPLPVGSPTGDLYLAVDRAERAGGGDLTSSADRYLRLEPTPGAAAAGAADRHDGVVLRVRPAACGAELRTGPDGVVVAERLPAAALSAVPEAELAPLLKAARFRAALEGALYCPDDAMREESALRLYRLEPRDTVEQDLIAGLADDMPPVRYRALCALGIQGKAATQRTAGAIYRSPLAGTVMTPRVFDALLRAFADENAPWVAVEMVKAVGEQDYVGGLSDRRAAALAFLREAAGSVYRDVAEEAQAALARLGG
jgi:RNA:NAD 2'-phosphotransferase (TPT1/KptA family)